MKRIALSAVLATLALASTALAAPVKYDFDAAHTEVGFSVKHIFSKVPGRFTEYSGALMFDEKNFPASSVEFTIQAKSIDTNNERRDNHLRTGDFFDVEKYPTLSFKSTKVSAPKNGKFQVEGDLTMRGVTKRVVLDAEFLGAGPFGMGGQAMGYKAGFEAKTTVNRKDFGILWNKTLDSGGMLLGDDVDIVLHVEANKAQ